jgi:23S rRNA (uracil1939-C5)-methyltransferase
MNKFIIKLEKAVYGGGCLGYLEGSAVFVPYSLPGETVEIEITERKKNYAYGTIINLVEKSDARIHPECENFGTCGGCDYLHMDYSAELMLKRDIIIDCLRRIAKYSGDKIPQMETESASRLRYRSHASVKCSSEGISGFYGKKSRELVPFPAKGCILLSDALMEGIRSADAKKSGDYKTAVGIDGTPKFSFDKDCEISESENNFRFDRHINCFFQANSFLRQKMLSAATDFIGLNRGETFLDIGCGVGFFTIPAARYAASGIGIDVSGRSIRWAKKNAETNGIDNIRFICLDASNINPEKFRVDTVLADPPRAGMSATAREKIIAINPSRIVYVSCSPATFSRDAADFAKSGYRLERLMMFDMFPATSHIELMSLLTRDK